MARATRTNRVLQISTRVRDRMTPALKASRVALKLLRTTARGTFRAIQAGARLAGRAIKAMLGPIGLLTTALSGFGLFKLVETATTVEDRVREIGTLIPDIGEQALETLSRDIRAAAVEGGQAFEQEFTAAYDAISAGVAPNRLIDFLGTANRLAVAGATDVGTSVDLLTGTLNAFGKDASEAERFADALFTTVRKGKTTVEELAAAMGQVSSISRLAGLSIEDTGAATAALTLTLGNTDLAATQLKAALSVLTKLTDQQRREAARLANGLDLSLENLQRKGLLGFLEEFNEKTEGSLNVIGKIIPNIRAVSGLAILAADNGQAFAEAADAMRTNFGAAADAFELRSRSAGTAFRRLRAAVFDIATEIGNGFIPILADLADDLRTFLQENRDDFRDWAAEAGRAIEFVIRALGPARDLVVDLFTDATETSALGAIFEDVAVFALATVKETATAAVRIVISVIRASFRNFVDVTGILAEQIGARILQGLVGPFVKLPALAAKAINSGLDLLPDAVRDALSVIQPAFGIVDALFAGVTNEQLDAEAEDLAARIVGVTEDKIKDAEDVLATLAQEVVENIASELESGSTAVTDAVDGIAAAFDELRSEFAALAPSSPAVSRFLDALQAIRDDMAGLEQQAHPLRQVFDSYRRLFDEAAAAAEQARRNAEALGQAANAATQQAGGPAGGAAPGLSPDAIARSEELLEEARRRMLRGIARTIADITVRFDDQVASYQGMLDRQEISQEAFNAISVALEGERQDAIEAALHDHAQAVQELAAQALIESGTFAQGVGKAFEELAERVETPFEAGFRLIVELSDAAGSAFNSAIDDASRGALDLEQTLEDLGRRALSIFGQIAAQQLSAAATSGIGSLFGLAFADGGVTPGPLRSIPFGAFQRGGITGSPMLALIGEGKQREAVVPLPDGRTIPAVVTDRGDAGGGQPINVAITIQALDAQGVDTLLVQRQGTIVEILKRAITTKNDVRATIRSV